MKLVNTDRLNGLLALVAKQAEDEDLWLEAETASEDRSQRALRLLHEAVEGLGLASKEMETFNPEEYLRKLEGR